MRTKVDSHFFELPIETADGCFIARYSNKGLAGLDFPENAKARRRGTEPNHVPDQVRPWHEVTTQALLLALAGQEPKSLPRLDLSSGTVFQQRVWNALRRIGAGKTRSYGEIAEAIGSPKAVRAVGGACGANPIPVFVPCHRVLAAHRKLGGFSGGLHWKRALLEREASQ